MYPTTPSCTRRCPYTLLGVPRSASPRTIRRAFRQKALLCHPDKTHNTKLNSKSSPIPPLGAPGGPPEAPEGAPEGAPQGPPSPDSPHAVGPPSPLPQGPPKSPLEASGGGGPPRERAPGGPPSGVHPMQGGPPGGPPAGEAQGAPRGAPEPEKGLLDFSFVDLVAAYELLLTPGRREELDSEELSRK